MGCSSSSEKEPVVLTDEQRALINEHAVASVEQFGPFKSATDSMLTVNPNAGSDIISDTSPINSRITNGMMIPSDVNGNRAMVDYVEDIKASARKWSASSVMPSLIAQKAIKNEKDERGIAVIGRESDAAVVSACIKYVNTAKERKRTSRNRGGYSTTTTTTTARPQYVQESSVVLPDGNWQQAEGTPFYWSEDEQLFFHPDSGQFYDPHTQKWYDPDRDEWYDEQH